METQMKWKWRKNLSVVARTPSVKTFNAIQKGRRELMRWPRRRLSATGLPVSPIPDSAKYQKYGENEEEEEQWRRNHVSGRQILCNRWHRFFRVWNAIWFHLNGWIYLRTTAVKRKAPFALMVSGDRRGLPPIVKYTMSTFIRSHSNLFISERCFSSASLQNRFGSLGQPSHIEMIMGIVKNGQNFIYRE